MQKTHCLQSSLRAVIKSIGTAPVTQPPYCSPHNPIVRITRSSTQLRERPKRCARHAYSTVGVSVSESNDPYVITHEAQQNTLRDRTDESPTLIARQTHPPRFRPGLHPDGSISLEYRRALERSYERSKRVVLKRAQIQRQKRSPHAVRIPDSISRMLREEDDIRSNPYLPRTEVLRLLAGQKASFISDLHQASLEILLRTGSHVQISTDEYYGLEGDIGNSRDHSFAALTLWGTPSQNAAAAQLLPNMVKEVSSTINTSLNVNSLHFHRESSAGSAHNQNPRSATSASSQSKRADVIRTIWSARWSEEETVGKILSQRPSEWDTLVFAGYVRRLTSSRNWQVRRQEQLRDGSSRTATDRVIAEIRHLTIDSPQLVKYISSEALDNILGFLLHRSRIEDVKDVIGYLETGSDYKMTASNYDTLLAAMATRGDLHTFSRSLQTMFEKRIRPTWQTWVALHRLALKSPSQQMLPQVFKALDRKGVLANLQATKAIAADAIKLELKRHLRRNGDLESFLTYYDRRFSRNKADRVAYGKHALIKQRWVSKEAIAFMVEELLALGRHGEALSLVSRFELNEPVMHWRIVRGMLLAALRAKDTSAAVATINHFRIPGKWSRSMHKLNPQIFDILFKLAWLTRSLNMLRVIWRYACLAARLKWIHHLMARQSMTLYPLPEDVEALLVSDKLHDGAAKTLAHDELTFELDAILGQKVAVVGDTSVREKQLVLSDLELFKRWAGKFIAGISGSDVELSDRSTKHSLSSQDQHLLEIGTSRRFLEDAEHKQRKESGLAMLHQDTLAWEHYIPLEPLYIKLDEAWRKDQEWKSSVLTAEADLHDLTWQHIQQMAPEERADKVFESLRAVLSKLMMHGVKVPVQARQHRVDSYE